eukprot:CAMPEP_0184516582 /NCGR_PEP_ID=MMETSP0198_2-20121128/5108_1 /TAXON_ID=1112570 /ORGANISM="Thraustochytrium sp., Strain LLF1b" /LENGTH=63 /DNA_ID=CAMNT_0026906917 /DNA_START=249 /DNA_END=440 /DNA_ORIENTATION=+
MVFYASTWLYAVAFMSSEDLEESFASRGKVFALVAIPTSIPVTLMWAYILWFSLKVFTNSPAD